MKYFLSFYLIIVLGIFNLRINLNVNISYKLLLENETFKAIADKNDEKLVNLVESISKIYSNKFEKLFATFKLNNNLKLNLINKLKEDRSVIETKISNLNPKFKAVVVETNESSPDCINFLNIINEFSLKNYDSNLKQGYG